jgi:hypothetical protein
MITSRTGITGMEARSEDALEAQYEKWHYWPINWSAVWVGTLAALAVALILGLIGIAVGAHLLGPENRVVDLRKISIGALIFSVCAAFFAFVAGGWTAGKIAGILRSEPAMVHGAIVWLVAVPLLLVLASITGGSFFGGWYAGLAGNPAWGSSAALPFERPEALSPSATEPERAQYDRAMGDYSQKVRTWREETPKAARNSALGAVTALLLGLVGSVLGGWMASGEPMNFTHYRTRHHATNRVPV